MKIVLTDGSRTAEITGDDDLIEESRYYEGTFERNAKCLITHFYRTAQGDVSQHVDQS